MVHSKSIHVEKAVPTWWCTPICGRVFAQLQRVMLMQTPSYDTMCIRKRTGSKHAPREQRFLLLSMRMLADQWSNRLLIAPTVFGLSWSPYSVHVGHQTHTALSTATWAITNLIRHYAADGKFVSEYSCDVVSAP